MVFAGTLTLTGGTVVIDTVRRQELPLRPGNRGCGARAVGFHRRPLGTAGTTHNLIYELRIGSKSTDPQIALNGNSGLQFRESE